jgi:hypothetical protein
VCRAAAVENRDAAKALTRWAALQRAHQRDRSDSELRFRRRAFERSRDRALIALALSPQEPPARDDAQPGRAGWRARRRRGSLPRRENHSPSKPK